MYLVAVREGFSEVSLWLRTKGHRRARHEKSEKKGGPGYGDSMPRSAHHEGSHSRQARPPHGTGQPGPAATCQSCPPPPCPSHSGLCSPDNSKQTGLTLGLMAINWSLEDKAAQDPRDLWDRAGQRKPVPKGEVGDRECPEKPHQASCIP